MSAKRELEQATSVEPEPGGPRGPGGPAGGGRPARRAGRGGAAGQGAGTDPCAERSGQATGAPGERRAVGGPSGRRTGVRSDEPPAKGIIARTQQLPGGRQVLAAFPLAVLASIALLFVPIFKEHKGDKNSQSLLQLSGPQALALVAIPVVITAVPLLFVNHPRRRLAWNGAAFMIGLWILLLPGLGIFYVFAAGGRAGVGSGEGVESRGSHGRVLRPTPTPGTASTPVDDDDG